MASGTTKAALFAFFLAVVQQSASQIVTAPTTAFSCPQLTGIDGNIQYFNNNQEYRCTCNSGFYANQLVVSSCNNGQWVNPRPCQGFPYGKILSLENGYLTQDYQWRCNAGYTFITTDNAKPKCFPTSGSQQLVVDNQKPVITTGDNVQIVKGNGQITQQGFVKVPQVVGVPGINQQVIQGQPIFLTGNQINQGIGSINYNVIADGYCRSYDGYSYSFGCNNGYVLNGANTLYLIGENKWSGKLPSCSQPQFPSGYIQLQNDGVTYSFSCQEGFTFYGNEKVVLKNNQWQSQLPACVPTHDLTIAHGIVSVKLVSTGYFLVYKCEPDYILVGDGENIVSNGQTLVQAPKCVPNCEMLKIDNGFVETNNNTNIAYFGCCDGFELVGNTQSTCESGRWTDEVPVCKPLCSKIDLLYGNVEMSEDKKVATFSCSEGYSLVGSTESTCENGAWTVDTPYCVPLCKPVIVENGNVTRRDDSQIFDVTCEDDYKLKGNNELVCNYGQWSHPAPVCVAQCQSLHIYNGVPILNKDQTVVRFICNENYYLQGVAEITCQQGIWSHPIPSCVPICQSMNINNVNQRYNCMTGVALPAY